MRILNFIKNNWTSIAPILLLIISEILPFIKNTQANGILHFIYNLIKNNNV